MIEVDNEVDLNCELKINKKVLALFYASWCPYCRGFLSSFHKNIANYPSYCIIRVNLDDYSNLLWDDYSVEAVPTIIFFNDGQISSRLDGKSDEGLNEKQLKRWLKNLKNPPIE
jgi:thioredoxin 1